MMDIRKKPNLCTPKLAFAAAVVAELVVLVIAIAGFHDFTRLLDSIALLSVMAQMIVLVSMLLLCLVRPLERFSAPALGWSLAFLLPLASSLLCALASYWMDRRFELNLVPGSSGQIDYLLRCVAITALVAGALGRYLYVRQLWQLQVQSDGDSRFLALQALIRPHFLFNSLNTVASLIPTEPEVAERLIEDFSELYRAMLRNDQGTTSLSEEISLLDRYLAVEGLRLGGRMTVDKDYNISNPDFEIPALLLQPLVENAIVHGIQKNREGGMIHIRIDQSADRLNIWICNPMPGNETSGHSGNGMAIDNIKERLRLRYGEQAQLKVSQHGDLFEVNLSLPEPKS